MALKIMASGDGKDSMDAVSKIKGLPETPSIVELGPGAGFSLRQMITSFQPSRIYAIEISEAFRNMLTKDKELATSIETGVLSVHDNDAKSLDFIPDNSVDLVFAFNVIYFLDPLDEYLKEMMRILKPGGTVNFCVKNVAKNLNAAVYINTDWDVCIAKMKEVGFVEVEEEEAQLEGSLEYIPLKGKKPN